MRQQGESFLMDPPLPGVDLVEGVLLLDVDGVINVLDASVDHSALPTVRGASGRLLPVNLIESSILSVLDGALQAGIVLGWLTTWGDRVSLLEGLLNGLLRGGFVVAERPSTRFAPAEWKHDAAISLMAQYPEAALAWVDDDAIPIGLHHRSLAQRFPTALLVAPNPEIGLTADDAQRIAAHLSAAAR